MPEGNLHVVKFVDLVAIYIFSHNRMCQKLNFEDFKKCFSSQNSVVL